MPGDLPEPGTQTVIASRRERRAEIHSEFPDRRRTGRPLLGGIEIGLFGYELQVALLSI
ncbi:hypothetical protein Acsp04_17830 [Actinomadura sp. NBRC 104425]|uniref:hypothetical protein n=1 Tax=Actinomadura sp. NBRC 104425 TaxID=3032204 RepID=UPI00249FB2AF|nr:hypothetical protein [Actinomadura sp. NBRC 104425]GLZ11548.1 hypothetical protein Acsp04_17830 [Actinomadura sp. NBRC 104425]